MASGAETFAWSKLLARVARVLAATDEMLAAWVGVSAGEVAAWRQAGAVPDARAQHRLRQLDVLAAVLSSAFVSSRIRAIVHERAVPLLAGRSYSEALAWGFDVEILCDLARSSAARPLDTPAGVAYLDGPGSPGRVAALAWMRTHESSFGLSRA